MSIPATHSTYRWSAGSGPFTLVQSTEPLSTDLGPHDVLLKIHAASLNYRDLIILNGYYPFPITPQGVPVSDGAGEVAAIGSAVKGFKVGDRVSPGFNVNRYTEDDLTPSKGLGGEADGVLRQYGVFEDRTLAHLPDHVSFEEASTIVCAGTTAWNAVNKLKGLSEKSTVLLEGTGGVSLFALHILVAAGVNVIITSSSDDKLAAVKKISPLVQGINYKTHTDIAEEVKRLTDGKGVNLVVNNIGEGSVASNVDVIVERGQISLVGALAGVGQQLKAGTLLSLMFKRGTIQGIAQGSTDAFHSLVEFIGEKKVDLSAIVDRVFAFEDASKAYEYLGSGKHIGKVVIKV
ncbi:hypothetical protein ACHAQA_004642 [Verticillium albo-atrum]